MDDSLTPKIINDYLPRDLYDQCLKHITKATNFSPYEGSPIIKAVSDETSKHLIDQVNSIVVDRIKELFDMDLVLDQGYMVVWPDGSNGAHEHIDSHVGAEHLLISTVVYLNDDYEGGQINFPTLGISHKPAGNQGIHFKSDLLHSVSPNLYSRYNIVMWHRKQYI